MTSLSYGAPGVAAAAREVRIDKRMDGTVTVLSLRGDLDARTSPRAQADLSGLIPGGTPVLLDLAGVGYVSSAGLRTMLMVYRRAQSTGAAIALAGVSESLCTILSATGFLRFFRVAESVPEAIGVLRAPESPAPAGDREKGTGK
ncbi:STAS domain-containing protein [Actinoplanes sp. RD1]|uniref:STAS domain-containing protein n=1 Tax=Actinoplanes sp. RD1 TaxID=3064538 RepID=UPI0027415990|nr:STAS domain-containing protein [Actinoplanes sp. RD1]